MDFFVLFCFFFACVKASYAFLLEFAFNFILCLHLQLSFMLLVVFIKVMISILFVLVGFYSSLSFCKPPVDNMDDGEGIPGDGRCLFRSVIHGAWLRAGKQSPSDSLQKELADELRHKVADEFVKRRADTEWFVEGDFDTYVVQMRQPHIWGGEPELLMSSHVLKMPITVYMRDKTSGTLKIIAEYGQEYGKENPIRVQYHGYGHYDVLRNPVGGTPSKLSKKRWCS
ncbi:hypothetical protein Pint_23692 [Pistacia integerrima]|uniref:Uncharacterized protein n=1 Tax=Pistacia integerrima TaxID=434235 RepID=A0ACC0YLP2_9ROSI|nr:hypothetical protein Pint_23692 [Pistacia integerrima]